MSEKNEKNRMIHFDLLRILAAFSVVMLHSAAQFWYTLDIYGKEWIIANSYDAVFRFGVPVFVMLSGALFLAPDYKLDVKRLYKRNILRMIVIYAVWSCIYGLGDSLGYGLRITDIKPIIREMLSGRYHLWFLPMIIGIYVLLPVLKSWVEHAQKKNLQYFLGLFIVLQVCSETLRALTVMDELHGILDLIQVELVCGYVGYFVLGYYLVHVGMSEKLKKAIYVCVIPAVLLNILLGNALAWRAGTAVGSIYDSFGLFTFIIVVAVFLMVMDKAKGLKAEGKAGRVVKELSADTLGVYVMHVGLMELTQEVGLHSMSLPNIVGIPLYALLCMGICTVAAALLRRIPFVGKYIC